MVCPTHAPRSTWRSWAGTTCTAVASLRGSRTARRVLGLGLILTVSLGNLCLSGVLSNHTPAMCNGDTHTHGCGCGRGRGCVWVCGGSTSTCPSFRLCGGGGGLLGSHAGFLLPWRALVLVPPHACMLGMRHAMLIAMSLRRCGHWHVTPFEHVGFTGAHPGGTAASRSGRRSPTAPGTTALRTGAMAA